MESVEHPGELQCYPNAQDFMERQGGVDRGLTIKWLLKPGQVYVRPRTIYLLIYLFGGVLENTIEGM